jgi:hypothetical protein
MQTICRRNTAASPCLTVLEFERKICCSGDAPELHFFRKKALPELHFQGQFFQHIAKNLTAHGKFQPNWETHTTLEWLKIEKKFNGLIKVDSGK